MSVNSYLQGLASDLVLSEVEKEHVKTSLNRIITNLNIYFGDDIIENKVFGSFTRGTVLPRKVDEESDIDLMVVFNNQYNYQPQTFLNKLKDFVEHFYISSEIHQSSPTIVLELQHIKFELTPAYILSGMYYIPNGPSYWRYTNPKSFDDKLVECNNNNAYKIKPVVRLLKYWNINKNSRDIASYELEKTIAEELLYAYLNATSYTEYLLAGFEKIKFKTDYSRVNTAINCINSAINYENLGMSISAKNEIKKVFPEL